MSAAVELIEKDGIKSLPPIIEIRQCKKCTHLKVCAVIQALSHMLSQWETEKPFEADQVAEICNAYYPN